MRRRGRPGPRPALPMDHEQPRELAQSQHGRKLRCQVSALGADTGDEWRLWETALFLAGASGRELTPEGISATVYIRLARHWRTWRTRVSAHCVLVFCGLALSLVHGGVCPSWPVARVPSRMWHGAYGALLGAGQSCQSR